MPERIDHELYFKELLNIELLSLIVPYLEDIGNNDFGDAKKLSVIEKAAKQIKLDNDIMSAIEKIEAQSQAFFLGKNLRS